MTSIPHGPTHFDAIDVGYQDLPGAANSFLWRTARGPVLIETGPQACLARLERGLRERGVEPASITHVFLTHIHLDHAGAAGAFAARGATLHVHPFGAKHLVDPAKLIASSRRVHGANYERWYGDPVAAPVAKVVAEPDGAKIDLGSITLEAVETPGHARHHHAWLVRASALSQDTAPSRTSVAPRAGAGGVLFTGDVAATFVPGSRFIGIPTPPPEYDLEAWQRSLDRMRALAPERLVLTHGGAVDEPARHLDAVRARLLDEDAWQRAAIETGEDDATILPRYRRWLHAQSDAAGAAPHARDVFIGDAWMLMNLMGVRRAMSVSA